MIEKFTFDLNFGKKHEKLILVKADFEKREHIVMKLLAYLLYHDPRLKIETDAGMHYKPDLVIMDEHGPELWIDCGQIAVRKVETMALKMRRGRFIILKETQREMDLFRKVIDKKMEGSARIEYLSFEKNFIRNIAEALARTNSLTLYEVMENVIGVALNDEVFESELYRAIG